MCAHFVYTSHDYVCKVLATTCKRYTFVQTVSLGSGNWQKQADAVLVATVPPTQFGRILTGSVMKPTIFLL